MWAKRSAVDQQVLDPDEHPVTYRTQRAPLLPTPQSSRAPWLHTAAVTASKFKQASRVQTARPAYAAPLQVRLFTEVVSLGDSGHLPICIVIGDAGRTTADCTSACCSCLLCS